MLLLLPLLHPDTPSLPFPLSSTSFDIPISHEAVNTQEYIHTHTQRPNWMVPLEEHVLMSQGSDNHRRPSKRVYNAVTSNDDATAIIDDRR